MHTFKSHYIAVLVIFFAVLVVTACDRTAKTALPKTDTAAVTPAPKPEVAPADSGRLVGAWHDEAIKTEKGESIAYEVVSSGKKVYIQAITFTGTNLTLNDTPPITPSATEIRRVGNKYVSVERPEESYKIDKKGNLLIYDHNELITVCKKIL